MRRRLVLSVTGLILIASIAIGIALPLILRDFLISQVDTQLNDTVKRATSYGTDPDDSGAYGSPKGLVQPGQSVGTLAAFSDGTYLTACAYLNKDGKPSGCTPDMIAAIGQLWVSDEPKTVHLSNLGDYRVTTVKTSDGIFVAGLPMKDTNETVSRLIVIEVTVLGAVLVIAAIATATMIDWTLRPLRRVASTAKRVSAMPLDKGEVDLAERVESKDANPGTEVGQVGAALNQLLDHVDNALDARHRSESQVRAFVADASHELRTPLAAIRGYAELTRRTRSEMTPDVAHALTRIESESERMTALVQDLLLLARLDSGRPLRREPVDLAPLIIDAVSDAQAAGPAYQWDIDLPDETVEVTGDASRLHQVLANLLSNARTHTPEGTTVTTSLSRTPDGTGAVIEVTDDGPGIPQALQTQVFDRFARGDSSRSREKGSTGLGLAIVQAVVASHGGRVAVNSVPGRTSFRVTLPIDRRVGP
ncbi:sensor histidine kinase [Epidermidibacterium keratini]